MRPCSAASLHERMQSSRETAAKQMRKLIGKPGCPDRSWRDILAAMQPCFPQRALAIVVLLCFVLILHARAQGPNLLQNPGFEQGTAAWFGFGPVNFTTVASPVNSGGNAARIQNRSDSWNGVAQSLAGMLEPGKQYSVRASVRVVAASPQPVRLTIQRTDGSGTSYHGVASATATPNTWTQLGGSYTHAASGTLTALNLYMEGPEGGVDFYADDFAVEGHDWKAAANDRIESIRKRDVLLHVIDATGKPVSGATVSVAQTRHRFGFGSAINGNISNPQYAAFFRTNFQWAVMENEAKWYANEPSQGSVTYNSANAITNFCHLNGITLRGHTIFWAVDRWVQPWVTNLSNANLLIALTNRLNSAVNHFKGTFVHWDVNNEMLHGDFFGDRLGTWVNSWMFKHAHALDPSVRLFVNDYNVVSANETDAYKQQIQSLLASNAPIHGIGAQGHFGSVINTTTTESRLDSLAELGLPIWITEYDSVNEDEFVRADNLEKLYRIAFSKPSVDGVIMWGFWAGSHWRGSNAAIVNLNWTLNEAGRRYQALLAEWTTRTNGGTLASGEYSFRGFHGNYDVAITVGGQSTLRKIALEPGSGVSAQTIVVNPGNPAPVLHSVNHAPMPGQFSFQVSGNAGGLIQILMSTNLATWTPLTNVLNAHGTISFTHAAAAGPVYFRAKVLD